jgi:uncharacterized RDD family membrane protein YckC
MRMLGNDPSAALHRFAATPPSSFVAALLGGAWMHVASEALHGSTVGKRLCGITVVAEHGGPPRFDSAARRTLAYYLDSLLLGFPAADAISASPLRQRAGDRWAHTLVVRLDSPEARSGAGRVSFFAAAALGPGGDALFVVVARAAHLL